MKITFLARHTRLLSAAIVGALVVAAGCSQSKTSNPLSPLIAGPIEGVEITLPKVLEPGQNWKIEDKNQPLTLILENPTSNSPRPYLLRLQVATDAAFANIVFQASGLQPGPNGRTSFRLPDRLTPGRTYLWRARAEDGANNSDWSVPAQFEVLLPIVIGTPIAKSPAGGIRTTTRQPTLVAANGASSGPHGPLFYHFQLSATPAFGELTANAEAPQSPTGETALAIPSALPYNTELFWRVRITDGLNSGSWSPTEVFKTPLAPEIPPGGGPGPGGSCKSNNGPAIIACIAAKYPERLQPVGSVGERQHNMEFLRDRIIEAGRCGGMDLAWNLKRGGPEISIDFLAWQDGGTLRGMDLAYDYDNHKTKLHLTWAEGTFPYYGKYTNPFSCSG